MVPPEYSTYFVTLATVGAMLFGLIFVAISISPESVAATSAPLERQAKAVTAYVALLNPLIISLFALVPRQQVGVVVISIGISAFVNNLAMTLALFQNYRQWRVVVRNSGFVLIGFLLYGLQIYDAIRLLQQPADASAFNLLANLLVSITILGIARAWGLVGIRRFSFRGRLS